MNEKEWLAAAFEEQRDHLRAVAYRLLGSMADADDAVQDTWLRLTAADTDEVNNLGGWLTTIVARVSLNMLRTRRYRRETPVGGAWPGAAEEAAGSGRAAATGGPGQIADPEEEAVLADSVGLALLVVLDTLTPAQRLVFVLHDIFAMSFDEVAAVLRRSPEATRQLASRARRRVRGVASPDRAADLARQREAVAAFLAASRGGDMEALVALLDSEVTLTADAASVRSGREIVLQGAEVVARGALVSSRGAGPSQLALVDGAVGIVVAPAGHLQTVLALIINAEGQISAIDVIGDHDRLRKMQFAVLPD